MQDKIRDFLKELTELSKKHGVYIYSCTCCHSLEGETSEPISNDELGFDREKDAYVLG